MSKLTVAIVGLGHIAETVHIPYFHQNEQAEVVALCSRSLQKARETAAKFGIAGSFDNIDQMLQTARPDIVAVCTPNAFHYEAVLKALEAGCHVFCEKPPATTYEQAKTMEAKAAEKGKLLAYNLTLRQKQETLAVREQIMKGTLGNIYHINASFIRRRGIPGWGNFTNKDIQGGGALIDIGVHILDLALHLLGYPTIKGVMANTYDFIGKKGGTGLLGKWDHENFTVEDACFAHIKLAGNRSITLQAAFALNTKATQHTNIELFGSEGGASLFPLEYFTEKDGQLLDTRHTFLQDTNAQQISINTFIEACLGNNPTNLCTAAEGTALQHLLELIYADAANS